MNQFQEIDQYLNGELKEAEKIAFENRLNTEPDLRKAFEAQKKMELALNEIRTEQVVKEVGQKYRLIRKKRRTFLLVTASILFLIFLGYRQNLIPTSSQNEFTSVNPEVQDLVLSLYDKYNNLATQANSLEPLNQIAALIPVDPNQALKRIKPFAGKNKTYDYYFAHAKFKIGAYQEADLAFKNFKANITEADPLFQDYQFFNILNLILISDSSSYQPQLQDLLSQERHQYHDAFLELSKGLATIEN